MKDETIRNIIWAIAITLMVLGFFAFLSILSLPAKWTIEIQMDNNTREAIQSINYSAMNQEKQDPEWMHYAPAMNFSCFGMQCSPMESIYIKGIGVCYNKSEGIICPI